jgi:hypothetical protein
MFYPWKPAPWPTKTPLSALISGPLAGGNWELGDNAPRTIAQWYWEEVCPQSERTIITSNEAKNPMRWYDAKNPVHWHEGAEVFKHYVQLLKDTPGRCVEITASHNDNIPQLFDQSLLGGVWNGEKSVTMSELVLNTPSSRLLGPSDVVAAAIARNMGKFLPPGLRSPKASQRPFERTMAVHIRRGAYRSGCKARAEYASTYYQWCARPACIHLRAYTHATRAGTCSRRCRTSSSFRRVRATAMRRTPRRSCIAATATRRMMR